MIGPAARLAGRPWSGQDGPSRPSSRGATNKRKTYFAQQIYTIRELPYSSPPVYLYRELDKSTGKMESKGGVDTLFGVFKGSKIRLEGKPAMGPCAMPYRATMVHPPLGIFPGG